MKRFLELVAAVTFAIRHPRIKCDLCEHRICRCPPELY